MLNMFSPSDSLYTITASGVIRPDSDYRVLVSLHKSVEPCTIKIHLKGSIIDDTKTIEVKPFTTECLNFIIPASIGFGSYKLSAEGVSGIKFNESCEIIFSDKTYSIFLQTDKATYKPGELVQFRAIFLDKFTCPWKNGVTPVDILIYDCSENRIKQFKNVTLTNGVFCGELRLSEYPLLGTWNIKVVVQECIKKSKTFNVDKYVLPKFKVSIEAPKDICIEDSIFATIKAEYTYGKPLKGKAIVTVDSPFNSNFPNITKTISVDGTGYVEFGNCMGQKMNLDNFSSTLNIAAVIEEDLTGVKLNASTSITVHRSKYEFSVIDSDFSFTPDEPLHFKIAVKNLDGTPAQIVRDNLMILTAESPDKVKTKVMFKSKLNEHGIAEFELLFTDKTIQSYSINVQYNNVIDKVGWVYKLDKNYRHFQANYGDSLETKILTEKPSLNENVIVNVSCNKPFDYFFYQVTACGEILQNELIQLPEKLKTATFKVKPSAIMKGEADLLVHYIQDGKLIFSETSITFNQFENSIELKAPEQAKPGENIQLSVKTNNDSFVGLLGVDQSVLLLKDGNDLEKHQIFDGLKEYNSTVSNYNIPGSKGLIFFTNAKFDRPLRNICYLARSRCFGSPAGGAGMMYKMACLESAVAPIIRKNFVETWIWDTFNVESESDVVSLSKIVPDTITSWIVTGFSINSKTGFALTEEATKMRVFQPFFVSINLPYSVRRGEIISIPIVVSNYMETDVDAIITLDNTNDEFEFIESIKDKTKITKPLTVPRNLRKSISFDIRPKKVGNIILKVTATSPLAGDAVHQFLRVEPEVVTEYVNKAFLINLNNNKNEQTENVDIIIPKDSVQDSEYIEVSVVGDLLGPTIQNLDKLVRMPCGCGEQTMVNFVPNILVLKYLTSIEMLSPAIEQKAKNFLELGYQRELTYKHDDGSYSAFGKSDKAGSTWLTAYVARSFHQAAKFTEIDPKMLDEALTFLASTQNEDGTFTENGKLFDFNPVNDGKNLSLTAFVLLAFLENSELISKFQKTIDRTVQLLEANLDKCEDIYALAICAYALQLSKNNIGSEILKRLHGLAKSDDDRLWWTMSTNESKCTRPHVSNVDVELTSYILLAILEDQFAEPTESLSVVKWLVKQRNSNGGFQSTQDTVIGLQGLIKFSENSSSLNKDIQIVYSGDVNSCNGNITVNSDNSLLLQTHTLPSIVRKIELTAKGRGSSLVQISYKYNMVEAEKDPRFIIEPTVEKTNNPFEQKLNISTSFIPIKDDTESSNMAVMEVTLPSGYIADDSCFDSLMKIDLIKRIETKNDNSCIIIYFDHLTSVKINCTILAIKSHDIQNLKPAPITVYDYYDNEKRSMVYYSFEDK